MPEYIFSIQVNAEWDAEAGVWVATSEDVPGLVAEHSDFKELQNIVHQLIPVLLIENKMLPPDDRPKREIPVHIAAHATSRSMVAA